MNAFPDKPSSEPVEPDNAHSIGAIVREEGVSSAADISSEPTAIDLAPDGRPPDARLPDAHPPDDRPHNPAWSGLDVLRLTILAIIALFMGIIAVLFIARFWIFPHSNIGDVARIPLVVVAGQALAYLLVLGYMYILVTRESHQPDFLAAIHWKWPASPAIYVVVGIVMSVALQLLASRLPIPKNLPIDTFFRTSGEAWALTIFGVTLAPLLEELYFRGFLYPVLARSIGLVPAVLITAVAFALLHASQLNNSWGPVLVIFLVGIVLTTVRAKTNSVAAGLLIHVAYNGTISSLMFFATDGFRHLEKLNQ